MIVYDLRLGESCERLSDRELANSGETQQAK
jgi:hypothetical protein